MLKSIIIYLMVYLITILFAYQYQHRMVRSIGRRKSTRLWEIMWFLLISTGPVVLATIRKNVGTDCETYRRVYNYVIDSGIERAMNFYMEKGYMLLNVITAMVIKEDWGIFLSTSILFMWLLFFIFKQWRDEISLPMGYFVFFTIYFHVFFNAMRQMIAVLIMMIAAKYLFEKKYGNCFLWIGLASLFHISGAYWAIILIFMYLIRKFIFQYRVVYIFICVAAPAWIGLFYSLISKIVILFMPNYMGYLKWNGSEGYGYYLYIIPPLLLMYILYGQKLYRKEEYLFYYLLMWLQIPFQTLGTYVSVMDRFFLYAASGQIVLVPILLHQSKVNKIEKHFLFIVWYLFKFLFMEFYMTGNETGIYRTIFEQINY